MKIFVKKSDSIRKTHNNDILRRMETGESLSSFNSQASWFPPRQIIEKDPDAVKKLYGNNIEAKVVTLETEAPNNASPKGHPLRPA